MDHPQALLGAHPLMQRLLKRIETAARARSTVLVVGETGTGKELVAATRTSSPRGPPVRW